MNDNPASSERLRATLHRNLDRRLKASGFGGGVSEAHGLLSGLACRGIPGERIGVKARLLQLTARADIELLEGMYGLLLRELQSDEFAFTPLLPGDDDPPAQRIESLADWCGGFLQGFWHDGDDTRAEDAADAVRESLGDIMAISRVDAAEIDEHTERQLTEIEEYLRVAVQMVFEELNAASAPPVRVLPAGQ